MLKTTIVRHKLRDLKLLGPETGHDNARFMKPAQFKRLVENIRKDGVLTSAPLVARFDGEDGLYVASGNHRVSAAIEAGIEEADCIEILEPLSRQQFIALQLSHNAIAGEDDKAALQRLYEELDLDLKEYSGLTDDAFDMDDLNVTTIAGVSPMYMEVIFSFLADDAQAVDEFLKSADRWSKKNRPVFVAERATFQQFFDTLVRVKNLRGITNSAVALATMIQLAQDAMDREEAEHKQSA